MPPGPPVATTVSSHSSTIHQYHLYFDLLLCSQRVAYITSVKKCTDTTHYLNLYNKRRYVCLFVCLYLCSVRPAKRLGRSRPNLTHALMSTQGVFLSRSMSRSFMYACGSDRITKHPERCAKATPGERCSNYVRRTGDATPGERLRNSVRTTGNYSSSNEARRRSGAEQRAPKARVELQLVVKKDEYKITLHANA